MSLLAFSLRLADGIVCDGILRSGVVPALESGACRRAHRHHTGLSSTQTCGHPFENGARSDSRRSLFDRYDLPCHLARAIPASDSAAASGRQELAVWLFQADARNKTCAGSWRHGRQKHFGWAARPSISQCQNVRGLVIQHSTLHSASTICS